MVKLNKLNFWQRVGVVASALWCITTGLWRINLEVELASKKAAAILRACNSVAASEGFSATDCTSQSSSIFRGSLIASVDDVFLLMLGPIAAAWVLTYLTLGVARWIWAGRSVL